MFNPGQQLEEQIVQYCLKEGLLSQQHIDIAFKERAVSDVFVGKIFLDLGFLSHNQMQTIFSKVTGYGLIDLKNKNHVEKIDDAVIVLDDNALHVGVEDPTDLKRRDQTERLLHAQYGAREIHWYHHHGDLYDRVSQGETETDLLNTIMQDGVLKGASDIHMTPGETYWRVQYRIHGVMGKPALFHHSRMHALVIRLKVMSDLDIAQIHKPQSGEFVWGEGRDRYHCRLSTHPCLGGEKIAIRILHLKGKRRALNELGFDEGVLNQLHQSIVEPTGLIVLAGATGSGKTTTLYAFLDVLAERGLNIMTLEDPVESTLDYAVQTEVSRHLDYADGVRSLMRQDPDVILIGEIRDAETAQMAMRAAMTGHLVLTTLHADSIHGIQERLIDLGLSESLLKMFLKLSLIQKLESIPCPIMNDPGHSEECSMCKGMNVIGRRLVGEVG